MTNPRVIKNINWQMQELGTLVPKQIKPTKLHMGCGLNHKKGYLNVDFRKQVHPDKTMDLDKIPLPWKNNTFDEILAEHVLEHLQLMQQNPIKYMEELWRITKPGGKIFIEVPYGPTYQGHLEHTRGFTYDTFNLLNTSSNRGYNGKAMFKIAYQSTPTRLGWFIPNIWVPFSHYGLRDTIALMIGLVNKNIRYTLTKVDKRVRCSTCQGKGEIVTDNWFSQIKICPTCEGINNAD